MAPTALVGAALQTQAVIFEHPKALSLGTLDLNDPAAGDVVVEMKWSGISTGTEKLLWCGDMPWFPGLEYPLVPGYEGVGDVVEAGPEASLKVGQRVFVPGANCYQGARGLFGASAQRVVVPAARTLPVDVEMGDEAILLSLAATAEHAIAASPEAGETLIVGHGVVGRLIARLMMARGDAPPTVWEIADARSSGGKGYDVIRPEEDPAKGYDTVIDASGDPAILDTLISRINRGGEIVLAGFYATPLSFAFPPAFMREARIRVAAEFKPQDLATVRDHIAAGRLSLANLITHRRPVRDAARAYETAFTQADCLKMVLDWSADA
jgi:3-hydroxyethyl bacteriochlorophyllide a dehydrogenase